MSYGRRRNYRRSRGSSSGFGSMVGDTAAIANKFGPKGALITGAIAFLLLYFVVPWLLVAWLDYNKAKISTGAVGDIVRKILDDTFIRRFIHPAEWAGIAALLVGVGIACWKALTRSDLNYADQRDMGTLAKLIARFLD